MSSEGGSWKTASTVYEFTANNINGEPVSLEKYRGHVLVIVNVASKCGLASTNYEQLNQLHDKYHEKGLRILAFPCNQFAGQEPGSSDQICAYAKKKNINFDMFDKVDVNGDNAHPLWNFLKMKQPGTFGNMIKWNFSKFLVNKEGIPVDRYAPTSEPMSKGMVEKIEKLLG